MKKILLLLLLFSFAFADSPTPVDSGNWLPTAGIALMLSITVLAAIYAFAFAFEVNELKFMVSEELYQVIITAVLIAIILGANLYFNELANYAFNANSMPEAGAKVLEGLQFNLQDAFNGLRSYAVDASKYASKSSFCAIQGQGVNIAPCGAYRALTVPIAMAMQMVGLGIAEISSLSTLVNFGGAYAFSLILPAGILLRTFRATRGAGGILIAFAVSIYLLLPFTIVFMADLNSQVLQQVSNINIGSESEFSPLVEVGTPDVLGYSYPKISFPPIGECDAFNMFEGSSSTAAEITTDILTMGLSLLGGDMMHTGNFSKASKAFIALANASNGMVYLFLINCTLTALVSLTVMIIGMQNLAKLAGSDVDLSALSRVV